MDFFAIEAHASDAKLHVISSIPTARCELVRVARNSKRRHRRGALTRRVFAVDRFGLSQHRARLNLIGAPAVKAWMKGESRSEPANRREIASIVRRSANR